MWRLIRTQTGPQQCGDIGGVLNMLPPRRVGAVVSMYATIVDLGQACQQSGDRRRGRR
jgi:hypothetical protein